MAGNGYIAFAVALGLILRRHIRRDLLLVYHPIQNFSRTANGVSYQPPRLEIKLTCPTVVEICPPHRFQHAIKVAP